MPRNPSPPKPGHSASAARKALTVAEVADRIGCSWQQVANLVDSGELTALNIASPGTARRALRFPVEAVEKFMEARKT